jgi:hypothetical protein
MKKTKTPSPYSSPQWGEDIMLSLSPWGRGQGEGAFLLLPEFTRDKKTYVRTMSRHNLKAGRVWARWMITSTLERNTRASSLFSFFLFKCSS